MKRSEPQNRFELENLEQRILLSGDHLAGAVQALAPDEVAPYNDVFDPAPIEENLDSGDHASLTPSYQDSSQYDPSKKLTGIFSGLEEENLFADEGDDVVPEGALSELVPDLGANGGTDTIIDTSAPSAPSNYRIGEAEKEGLIQGMGEIANLGGVLEDFDAFGVSLPLVEEATLGTLLGPYEVLDSRLSTPVYDYFSDATDPPTIEGLLEALQAIPNSPDLIVTIEDLSGRYDETLKEIRFGLKFEANRGGEVCLEAGPQADALGLRISEGATAAYVAGITFDFAFGVKLGDQSNEFFIEVYQLKVDLELEADLPSGADQANTIGVPEGDTLPETGPYAIQGPENRLDLEAVVEVRFDESVADDGRITLSELREITSGKPENLIILNASGTLFAELPLEETPDSEGTNAAGPTLFVLDAKSDDLFNDPSPVVSIKTDISTLKEPILDLLKGLSEVGDEFNGFESLQAPLPLIDTSTNEPLAEKPTFDLSSVLDLHTPALESFTLLQVFNFDIDASLQAIGALPENHLPDFDINQAYHGLKLKNVIEQEFNLSLSRGWDLSLYLRKIWALFNPDFEIPECLPKFQALLGLPYVPTMDQVRSDLKSYFRFSPSLKRLLDYIEATRLKPLFTGSSSQLSSDPFFPAAETGPSAVTVQIMEEAEGMGGSLEDLSDKAPPASEGRFDFDSREEIVFHGLDPPAQEPFDNLTIDLN